MPAGSAFADDALRLLEVRSYASALPGCATVAASLPEPTVPLLIYLVEDNPTIRDVMIQALREEFAACVAGVADNEADAVRWLTHPGQAWDLAIVDLFLKQGSGLGVLRALSSHRAPSRRVVVLSNYATSEMRERCLRAGADHVFDKSTELDSFLAYCQSCR